MNLSKSLLLGFISVIFLICLSSNVLAMPNPAAVFCIEQGNDYQIRIDESGNEYGICITDNEEIKDEWDFYKQKQGPNIVLEVAKKDISEIQFYRSSSCVSRYDL